MNIKTNERSKATKKERKKPESNTERKKKATQE